MTGSTVQTKRTQREKRLQASIAKNLRLLGFDVVQLSQPQRAICTPGTPDLYIRHRRWKVRIFVEVKTPKGKTSPFQDYWIGTELACGGNAIVARGIDDVLKELRRLGCPIT